MIHGNLVALIGSISSAIFISNSKSLRSNYSMYLNAFVMSFIGTILFSLMALVYDPFSENNTNSFIDIFQFRRLIFMSFMAFVTGVMTNILFIKIIDVFSNMLISITMLFQPIFGSFLIYFLGQQELPGWQTFIGFVFVIPGLFLIKEDISKHEIQEIVIEEADDDIKSIESLYKAAVLNKREEIGLVLF